MIFLVLYEESEGACVKTFASKENADIFARKVKSKAIPVSWDSYSVSTLRDILIYEDQEYKLK